MNNRLLMNHYPDQKPYKQASITSTNLQAKNFLEYSDSAIMTSQRGVKPRVLLAISVQLSDTMRTDIVEDKQPRRDYLALQEMLDADILYLSDTQKTRLARLIKKFFGPSTALTWAAFCRRRHYDVIFTTNGPESPRFPNGG